MPRIPGNKSPGPSAQVNDYKAELAALAAQTVNAEANRITGASWLSTKGGVLSVDDAPVPGSELEVIILGYAFENKWYSKPFVPGVNAIPDCFSFSTTGEDMVPHDEAQNQQAETCAECAKLEWNSAPTGRGKACKEVRRLALIVADEAGEPNPEVRFLSVPVMSGKNLQGYVRYLADTFQVPTLGAVTKLRVTPVNQVTVEFSFVEEVAEKHLPNLLAVWKRTLPDLLKPYEPIADAAPAAPAPGAGKFTRPRK